MAMAQVRLVADVNPGGRRPPPRPGPLPGTVTAADRAPSFSNLQERAGSPTSASLRISEGFSDASLISLSWHLTAVHRPRPEGNPHGGGGRSDRLKLGGLDRAPPGRLR